MCDQDTSVLAIHRFDRWLHLLYQVRVEVNVTPLIQDVFDKLIDTGATELLVVGYKAEQIIDQYGDEYDDIPITYTHQREQLGLAHAILQAKPQTARLFLCSAIMCSARTSVT